jgi:hypothetical protein
MMLLKLDRLEGFASGSAFIFFFKGSSMHALIVDGRVRLMSCNFSVKNEIDKNSKQLQLL